MHWPARQVPKITEICSTSAAWSVFCGWKKGTANSCIVSELISREIRTNVFILYYHNIHVKFGENLECVCYLYAGVVVVDKHRAYFVSPALFYSSPYITIRDMNMIAYWAWISMLSKLTRTRMFKVWKWNCERATAAAVNLYIAFCERHQWSKCRNNFQIRPTHIIIRREKKSNYHRVLVALTLSLLLYLPPIVASHDNRVCSSTFFIPWIAEYTHKTAKIIIWFAYINTIFVDISLSPQQQSSQLCIFATAIAASHFFFVTDNMRWGRWENVLSSCFQLLFFLFFASSSSSSSISHRSEMRLLAWCAAHWRGVRFVPDELACLLISRGWLNVIGYNWGLLLFSFVALCVCVLTIFHAV